MYKAIFIDNDGVLVDTDPLTNAMIKQVASDEHGIALSDQLLASLRGLDSIEIVSAISNQTPSKKVAQQIFDLADQLLKQKIMNEGVAQASGTEDFILQCKNLNLRCAVTSAADSEWLNACLKNVATSFDLILAREDVQNAKPAPDIYYKACSFFDLDPAECIVLDDSLAGISAANAAGCLSIAYDNEDPKVSEQAKHSVRNMGEASQLVQKLCTISP